MSKKAIVSSETLGFVLDDLSKSLGTHPGSVLIEGFESTTGITNSTNVTGLSVDIDHKGPGSYSIEFDKTGGTEAFAYVNNTLSSLDISRFAMDGSIIWFIYLSALTDIAHVRLFLGNSYDNCAYWQTADSSLSAGWNMLVHDLKSPTSFVGNGLNLSNITFIRAYVGFDATGNTLNDIRVDSVMVLPTESIVGIGGGATEATLSAIKTAVEIMDDWDETDRVKVNIIAGQAGIAGGTGVDGATVPRVSLATNVPLPTGTNAIGKLSVNDSVDIGDVTINNTIASPVPTGGNVAHDGVDSGNPVKVGGTYVASPVAVANNDRANHLTDSYGRARVWLDSKLDPGNDQVLLSGNDGNDGAGTNRTIKTDYRGRTHISGITDNSYARVTSDTLVRTGSGFLHTVVLNNITVNGTLTLYDNTAESGTVIAAIGLLTTDKHVSLVYDVNFSTGLYLGFDGTLAADITVSYQARS